MGDNFGPNGLSRVPVPSSTAAPQQFAHAPPHPQNHGVGISHKRIRWTRCSAELGSSYSSKTGAATARRHPLRIFEPEKTLVLGFTRQRIAALADENAITRLPSGRFNENDSRLRYLNWLRDPARRLARSEADARFVDANAELLRLRIAEKSRHLIPKVEVGETQQAIAAIVNVHLAGMAARCSPDLSVKRTIDRVVYEIRVAMVKAANKLADERGEPQLDASRG